MSVPLTGNEWTQAPDELNELVTNGHTLTFGAECGPRLPGGSEDARVEGKATVTLRIDRTSLYSTENYGSPSSRYTPGEALLDTGTAQQHVVTATVHNDCFQEVNFEEKGVSAKVTSFSGLDVVGIR